MRFKYYCHICNRWLKEDEIEQEDFTNTWETPRGLVTATIKLTYCKHCGAEIYNEEEERKNDQKVLGRSGKQKGSV